MKNPEPIMPDDLKGIIALAGALLIAGCSPSKPIAETVPMAYAKSSIREAFANGVDTGRDIQRSIDYAQIACDKYDATPRGHYLCSLLPMLRGQFQCVKDHSDSDNGPAACDLGPK